LVKRKCIVWSGLFMWIILALFFLWSIAPVYIIITNSIKENLDISRVPPVFIFTPTLRHYKEAMTVGNFALYFRNSIIIAGSTTIISVLCGAMGAYGLLLMKSGIWKKASDFMLVGKMVPSITILIPFYSILVSAGLNKTFIGPILAHCSINLPFVIWLIFGFMKGIPPEIFESAKIDGARRMQTFWKILIPLLLPPIGSAIILSLQYSWNELVYSLQLTTMESYTLPVGIGKFVGALTVNWGRSSAAATVTMVPIIIAGFLMQRYLVSGLTAGSVKE
jgi:ABC-type glycerol-3-phosphate transport system permease component